MLSGEKDPRFEDYRTAINHQIHKLVRTLIFGNIHIGNGNFLLPREQISTAELLQLHRNIIESKGREENKYCSDFLHRLLQISDDFC